MKILIAPDSFKGSLSAQESAEAIKAGLEESGLQAEFVLAPLADGGEGTVGTIVRAGQGRIVRARVTGPLGKPVKAYYGILEDQETAVIEMAAASGIQFVNKETMNPLVTTTFGTGQLIRMALDRGVNRIIVGLGGSATNDGGAGMAQALGAKLLDADGQEIPYGGLGLNKLAAIDSSDLDPRLADTDICLASDVDNPLTGPQGASAIYGPQKGADREMVSALDTALQHYAQIIRRDLGRDIEKISGSGAGGGLGAGFLAFTDANLRSGIQVVMEMTHFKEKAVGADYCFTGEGRIDSQTKFGKTPLGLTQALAEITPACKIIVLAGSVGEDISQFYQMGIQAIFCISPGAVSLNKAMRETAKNLSRVAESVGRLLR